MMFRAKFLIFFGCLVMLFALWLSYYTFFVPKVGPIGNGTYSLTTYIQLISLFFIGLFAVFRGIYILRYLKNQRL